MPSNSKKRGGGSKRKNLTMSRRGIREGRPKFEPTPEQRAVVLALMRYGRPEMEILDYLGFAGLGKFGRKTLDKYFAKEQREARAQFHAHLMTVAAQLAMGRPAEYANVAGQPVKTREEMVPHAGMCMFLLKTQCGMKETVRHTVEGGGAGAAPIIVYQDSYESKF